MREIIEATRFRPMQARTKVFVIDEVHMLSRNAFNALLKTLEEPPPHVKFVFATTELRKVPVTVLSRCQRFDLRRVRIGRTRRAFRPHRRDRRRVNVEPAALELIARAADGSVRDGLSLLDQAIAQADGDRSPSAAVADMLGLADRGLVFDLLDAVHGRQARPGVGRSPSGRYERGADLGMMLQDLLELVHTLTRLKSVPALRDSQDLPEAERTRGAALADQLSVPVLARAWQMLLKGVGEVETAPDRRAAAEMVLIRLCHVADLPPPGDLVRRLTAASTQAAGCRRTRSPAAAASARWPAGLAGYRRRCQRPARHRARQFPRRDRAGRGTARGDAARAPDPFGAPGPLRPAGDRVAAASRTRQGTWRRGSPRC